MQGDHTTAKDLRLRAEKLGAVLSDTVRMYRGRTFFYALRERAETDLLPLVDHPEYAPDALLFL